MGKLNFGTVFPSTLVSTTTIATFDVLQVVITGEKEVMGEYLLQSIQEGRGLIQFVGRDVSLLHFIPEPVESSSR